MKRWANSVQESKYSKPVSYLLLLIDAIACSVIISKVSYTEIDWTTYMQQASQVLAGERDYSAIKGDTGPLVYPAGHLYVYSLLHKVTDGGNNLAMGQAFFAILYLLTLATVLLCYRKARVPLYVLPLLILSKRLHSIYLLRLFNDGISAFLMSQCTYWYMRQMYTVGTLFFGLALSIKMNALLYLPAIGFVLLQGLGVMRALRQSLLVLQLQCLLAGPFLLHNSWAYLTNAFDFSRVFDYKWTVNWRFVDRETFLSHEFATALFCCHAIIIVIFSATRWNRPSRKSLAQLASLTISKILGSLFPTEGDEPLAELMPDFVFTVMATSNLIGVLFARSLHYQFYAWFAWAAPYMFYKTGLPPIMQVLLWFMQEWAWNVYPSTVSSSLVSVAVTIITVIGVWVHSGGDVVAIVNEDTKRSKKKVQ